MALWLVLHFDSSRLIRDPIRVASIAWWIASDRIVLRTLRFRFGQHVVSMAFSIDLDVLSFRYHRLILWQVARDYL